MEPDARAPRCLGATRHARVWLAQVLNDQVWKAIDDRPEHPGRPAAGISVARMTVGDARLTMARARLHRALAAFRSQSRPRRPFSEVRRRAVEIKIARRPRFAQISRSTARSRPRIGTSGGKLSPGTGRRCIREEMVGAARFELATPSPPDWCANRAALRSDLAATSTMADAGAQERVFFRKNQHLHRPGWLR